MCEMRAATLIDWSNIFVHRHKATTTTTTRLQTFWVYFAARHGATDVTVKLGWLHLAEMRNCAG